MLENSLSVKNRQIAQTFSPMKVLAGYTGQLCDYQKNPYQEYARITDENGNLLAAISGYWFAWINFHPQTSIYRAD